MSSESTTTSAEGSGGRSSRPGCRRLLAVLVGLVLVLVAVDVAVGPPGPRSADGVDPDGYYVPDERVGWLPRPHYAEAELETALDRFGMRNPELPADAPTDEVRVLGVGSSRFYGAAGVRQAATWGYHLQSMLDDLFPERVRVLNGSVMGYSAVQICRRATALLEAERDGVRLDPDLVLVSLSPGVQMMLDPDRTQGWTRVGGELIRADVLDGWPEWLWPVRAGLHRLAQRSNLLARVRPPLAVSEDEGVGKSLEFWSYSGAEQTPEVSALVERTFEEFAALRDAAASRGVELRVALLADPQQDSEARWTKFLPGFGHQGAPPVGTPRLEGVRLLRERLEELGLRVWDFSAEMEQLGADPERLYRPDRIHWSPDGHWIVAIGIMKRLRDERIVERLLERRGEAPR